MPDPKQRTTTSIALDFEERAWLVAEAAARAAETGQRVSVSAVIRDLVRQAAAGQAGRSSDGR